MCGFDSDFFPECKSKSISGGFIHQAGIFGVKCFSIFCGLILADSKSDTRVTHSHLLQGEEQPQCVGCNAPFTVRHFLLECGDFAQVRNNCFHVNNMKELFQDIHIDSFMTFLRQINLFNKI